MVVIKLNSANKSCDFSFSTLYRKYLKAKKQILTHFRYMSRLAMSQSRDFLIAKKTNFEALSV
ncbi:hypothetical protein ELAC_1846 [Estrella lausannensis]|uniref:Uncharacterized protein n=1 Tax=Estrella lausannensis TaxID=483423 RepID=A0A0H5DR67_9BACT|nr:hypothetical protein ELAC_1846 [Estrella lausannensis]